MFVVLSLDEPLPLPVLVNLIKDEEFCITRPGCGHDRLSVGPVVPIEVGRIIEVSSHKIPAEGSLPHLARPAHKDHFVLQVIQNILRKVSFFQHARIIQYFCLKAK